MVSKSRGEGMPAVVERGADRLEAMTDIRSIYVTTADQAQAEALAEALLEQRLIACANVLPGMRSLYRWEGRVQRDDEVAMILKTTASHIDDVLLAIEELHPYDVPCAVAWPVVDGLPAYLDWVREETNGAVGIRGNDPR